jgi:hypothetical protein
MGLIAEENSNGSHQTIMTKKNHSSASVSREASDVATVVITSTTYTASTTVSTTTTVINPIAAAALKLLGINLISMIIYMLMKEKDYQIQWDSILKKF